MGKRNRKKTILILLAAIIIIALLFALVSCDKGKQGTGENEEHGNTEYTDEKDKPDSKDDPEKDDPKQEENPSGETDKKDEDQPSGENQQEQKPDNPPGDAHKHSYTSKATKSASCKETGIKTYTCSCGDSYTETIPKTEHSYKNTVVAPTTEAQGYTLHKCSVCGNEYKDNYTAKLPKEEAHQHSWQPVYKTVHHDAVGHYADVLVQDAWDEPVYARRIICRTCGATFPTGVAGAEECADHCIIAHGGGSYYSGDVQVDTIHHDAVYENRFVEEKAAYDEQVLTGYSCSCGATKDAD